MFSLGESGLSIIRNIAPVAPDAVLAKIEMELSGSRGMQILAVSNPDRWRWIALLKSLAYEGAMFRRATIALARFVAVEPPGHNSYSAAAPFKELFHLYLSGTCATPQERQDIIRAFFNSTDVGSHRVGALALDALLQTGHFSAGSNFDFGARPRDYGWVPRVNGDIWNWYKEATALAIALVDRFEDAKLIIARNIRGLWRFAACREALEQASVVFANNGGWPEGWLSFRAARRFDGQKMPSDIRTRLETIIEILKPIDLLDRARLLVVSQNSAGYDIADGDETDDPSAAWHKALQSAVDVGKAMAGDRSLLKSFLPEVIAKNPPQRAFEFGRGLAQDAVNPSEMWSDLVSAFNQSSPHERNPTVLGGFIS
ncbi:hypothetical protein, partial [Inquilinus sp. OTU3971]|uniref:hypothetical protein n=1 Tax=Inquilinus sp. OTU3971 TaxID=3043855 RepID=UPI00313CED20